MIAVASCAHKCHRTPRIGTGVLDQRPLRQRQQHPESRQINALPVAMKKSSVPRGENSSAQRAGDRDHDRHTNPRRRHALTDDDPEAEDQCAGEARQRAADRLAVHVADAAHAELLLSEQRAADFRHRVGHDVGAPDQREHRGEAVGREHRREAAAERHHDELERRPQRGDQQAVRAREHAVHDPRLRSVKRRGEKSVSVIEREEHPARDDRVEQVVLQKECGKSRRLARPRRARTGRRIPPRASVMNRPRRPIMSTIRMRRSE